MTKKDSFFTPDAIVKRLEEVQSAHQVLAKYEAVLLHLADAIQDNRLAVFEKDDGGLEVHVTLP